jgi:exopolysaccharide biosynthesis protein
MKTLSKDQFNIDQVKQTGAWQIWSFGPMLLNANGQPLTKFNNDLGIGGPKNPRTAIGYYEPGHYCFVVVDGRQPGYSDPGMSLVDLSQLMYDLGCVAAYNLDGGQSSVMAYDGKWVNKPYDNGRQVNDILYIGESN